MLTAAPNSAPFRRPAVTRAEQLVARLKRDYAFWAETCYRIRDKHGVIRPLVLNRVQRAIGDVERRMLRERGQARIFALKARQGGVSTDQQGRNLHQVWSEPNFDALTLAHTREDTDKLFNITTRAIEHFPRALLPTLGGKATREVSFPGLDTHFFTGTAGAGRTGRGLTLKRMHGSEFAFWDDPESVLGTVTPALVPTSSVVTLETTASGFDSPAHNFWREAKARGYEPLFFAWWQCDPENYRLPLYEDDELGALSDEEAALIAAHGLDLEQIKWRRAKIAELGRAMFLTEYAEDEESCWASPGGMFYDVDLLKALILRAPKPIRTELAGALEIYEELPTAVGGLGPKVERVIIGADTAEGTGGDRSTWKARTFKTSRVLAAYQSDRVEPKEFAAILNTWGRRFGTALLVIEKNAHGITVLRELRDVHRYPTEYIYHRTALDTATHQPTERIGWATTGETQPLLLDAGRELLNAAAAGTAGVPCLAALRDAFGVRRGINGKISLNGKDMLVADMLAWIGRSAPIATPFIGRA